MHEDIVTKTIIEALRSNVHTGNVCGSYKSRRSSPGECLFVEMRFRTPSLIPYTLLHGVPGQIASVLEDANHDINEPPTPNSYAFLKIRRRRADG